MLPPVSPLAEAEGATCIIQVLSHHYQRAVHGTSISRSVSRTFLCPGERASEPFPMYQSISSAVVLDPPFSSIRCSFTHSFIRLLSARSLRKSPFRETYKSVTKKRIKERRKRRFASKRRGGGTRERMCALLAFTEPAVVQKNRITLHTTGEWRPIFDLQVLPPRGNQRLSAGLSFIHGRDSAFEGSARSSILVRSHVFQPRGTKLSI